MKSFILFLLSMRILMMPALHAEETQDSLRTLPASEKLDNAVVPELRLGTFGTSSTGFPSLYGFGLTQERPLLLGQPLKLEETLDPLRATDCKEDYSSVTDLKVNAFATSMSLLGGMSACSALSTDLSDNRYSETNCSLLVACSKVKMNKDRQSLMTSQTLPKLVAEDYVGLKLDRDILHMEKMENLRKFAEEKFGKDFSPSCKPIFNHRPKESATICNASVMDSGFIRMQTDCSIIKRNCYEKNGKDSPKNFSAFLKNFKPSDNEGSAVNSYFTERTSATVKATLGNDEALLEKIDEIISSTGSSDAKMDRIFNHLVELESQDKLDPVFNFSTESLSSSREKYKNSSHYSFFEGLIKSKSNGARIKAALENYRKDTAKAILDKSCANAPSFNDICQDATDVLMTRKVHLWDRDHAARAIREDVEGDRYEILKSLYPNGIQSLKDYSIIMEAQRCKAFSFVKTKKERESADPMKNYFGGSIGLYSPYVKPPQAADLWEDEHDGFGPLYNFSLLNNRRPLFDSLTELEKSQPAVDTAKFDKYEFAPIKPNEASVETFKKPDGKSAIETMSESFRNSGSGLSIPVTNSADNFGTSFNNNFSQFNVEKNSSDKNDVKPDVDQSASLNNNLTGKIDELSKRLVSSEENLARIKSQRATDEEELLKKQKLDEENKTIADLRAQINTLKAEALKKPVPAAVSVESMKAPSPVNAVSTAARVESSVQNSEIKDKNSAESIAKAPRAVAPSAPSGSAPVSPSGNGGGISSVDSRNGLILTKVDGLSSEKVAERIYEKITELKGAPFYIEEGGVLTEIIPEVVNNSVVKDKFGKPVFRRTKVVAAKSTDKPVVNRAPASITTKSELLQNEEKQRERTRYLNLKEITEGIRKK